MRRQPERDPSPTTRGNLSGVLVGAVWVPVDRDEPGHDVYSVALGTIERARPKSRNSRPTTTSWSADFRGAIAHHAPGVPANRARSAQRELSELAPHTFCALLVVERLLESGEGFVLLVPCSAPFRYESFSHRKPLEPLEVVEQVLAAPDASTRLLVLDQAALPFSKQNAGSTLKVETGVDQSRSARKRLCRRGRYISSSKRRWLVSTRTPAILPRSITKRTSPKPLHLGFSMTSITALAISSSWGMEM